MRRSQRQTDLSPPPPRMRVGGRRAATNTRCSPRREVPPEVSSTRYRSGCSSARLRSGYTRPDRARHGARSRRHLGPERRAYAMPRRWMNAGVIAVVGSLAKRGDWNSSAFRTLFRGLAARLQDRFWRGRPQSEGSSLRTPHQRVAWDRLRPVTLLSEHGRMRPLGVL